MFDLFKNIRNNRVPICVNKYSKVHNFLIAVYGVGVCKVTTATKGSKSECRILHLGYDVIVTSSSAILICANARNKLGLQYAILLRLLYPILLVTYEVYVRRKN